MFLSEGRQAKGRLRLERIRAVRISAARLPNPHLPDTETPGPQTDSTGDSRGLWSGAAHKTQSRDQSGPKLTKGAALSHYFCLDFQYKYIQILLRNKKIKRIYFQLFILQILTFFLASLYLAILCLYAAVLTLYLNPNSSECTSHSFFVLFCFHHRIKKVTATFCLTILTFFSQL